ncbi:MAG: hypothetical protein EOM53_01250 [Alphaproteobacteria bacterium]|nr:hypothetical protein [Alphaproteobacteria bacterium]
MSETLFDIKRKTDFITRASLAEEANALRAVLFEKIPLEDVQKFILETGQAEDILSSDEEVFKTASSLFTEEMIDAYKKDNGDTLSPIERFNYLNNVIQKGQEDIPLSKRQKESFFTALSDEQNASAFLIKNAPFNEIFSFFKTDNKPHSAVNVLRACDKILPDEKKDAIQEVNENGFDLQTYMSFLENKGTESKTPLDKQVQYDRQSKDRMLNESLSSLVENNQISYEEGSLIANKMTKSGSVEALNKEELQLISQLMADAIQEKVAKGEMPEEKSVLFAQKLDEIHKSNLADFYKEAILDNTGTVSQKLLDEETPAKITEGTDLQSEGPVLKNQRQNPFITNRKFDPLWKEAVAEVSDILDSAFKASTVEDAAVDFSLRLLVTPVTSVTRVLTHFQKQIQENMKYRHEQEANALSQSIKKEGHDAKSTAKYILEELEKKGLTPPSSSRRFSKKGRFIEKAFSFQQKRNREINTATKDVILDAMGRASVSGSMAKRKAFNSFLQEVQTQYNSFLKSKKLNNPDLIKSINSSEEEKEKVNLMSKKSEELKAQKQTIQKKGQQLSASKGNTGANPFFSQKNQGKVA